MSRGYSGTNRARNANRGTLIYECRRCAAMFEAISVPDIHVALACLTAGLQTPKEWGCSAKLFETHECKVPDGHDGVFIGVGQLVAGRLLTEGE